MTSRRPPREYSAGAAAFDVRWAEYNRSTLAMLRPLLTERASGRLLDVGCGTANLAAAMREWRVRPSFYLGIDLAPEMLRVAARKLRAEPPGFCWGLAAGDAAALPVAGGAFDTVVSASVLHDLPEPAAGIAAARRVLRPGGRLLLLDWARDSLPMRVLDFWQRLRGTRPGHVHTLRESVTLVEGAGFRVRSADRRRGPALWELLVVEAEAL